MVGSSIISASNPRIAQKAHSGVSPIIGHRVRDRYDRLWYHNAGRGRVALLRIRKPAFVGDAAYPMRQLTIVLAGVG
jgi:hypothetical protein